jgi:Uma2 family endonuclease
MHTETFDSFPVMAPHHKLTVEQYHLMAKSGILSPDERVELIEGELIAIAPIGCVHAALISWLIEALAHRTQGRAIAWVQNPIWLDRYSEPQPDFALLRYRPDRYKHSLPSAAEVLFLAEIADSSVFYDRKIKGPLYARHGIAEFWLIDIPARLIQVHLEPEQVTSCYRIVQTVSEGLLAPRCFPDAEIEVQALF